MATTAVNLIIVVSISFVMLVLVYVVSVLRYGRWRYCSRRHQDESTTRRLIEFVDHSQQDDVFTISGRMDQEQQQWPTHDGRLSIHQLSMAELNKPPGYNDAPPSYEEAMRIAMDQSLASSRDHQQSGSSQNSSAVTSITNTTTTTATTATTATTTVTTPSSTSVTIDVS